MILDIGDNNESRKKKKKKIREEIRNIYDKNNLTMNVNINKANIVLELLEDGLNYLKKHINIKDMNNIQII